MSTERKIKDVLMSKAQYDRLLKTCKDSTYTVDEFIAYKFLEHNPADVKGVRLRVQIFDEGVHCGTLLIDVGYDEIRVKTYYYRNYRIVIEPYGCKVIRYHVYKFFIDGGEDNWEYSDAGYTEIGYAIKFAKKAIDEHIMNAEWLGIYEHNGYNFEVFPHSVKGWKQPLFGFRINSWDGDPDDSQNFGYKQAVMALDAAESTIDHHLASTEINPLEDILDTSEGDTEAKEDDYWDAEVSSVVDEDEYWADLMDKSGRLYEYVEGNEDE